jgi:hypothetical protein
VNTTKLKLISATAGATVCLRWVTGATSTEATAPLPTEEEGLAG